MAVGASDKVDVAHGEVDRCPALLPGAEHGAGSGARLTECEVRYPANVRVRALFVAVGILGLERSLQLVDGMCGAVAVNVELNVVTVANVERRHGGEAQLERWHVAQHAAKDRGGLGKVLGVDEAVQEIDVRHPDLEVLVVLGADLLNRGPERVGRYDDDGGLAADLAALWTRENARKRHATRGDVVGVVGSTRELLVVAVVRQLGAEAVVIRRKDAEAAGADGDRLGTKQRALSRLQLRKGMRARVDVDAVEPTALAGGRGEASHVVGLGIERVAAIERTMHAQPSIDEPCLGAVGRLWRLLEEFVVLVVVKVEVAHEYAVAARETPDVLQVRKDALELLATSLGRHGLVVRGQVHDRYHQASAIDEELSNDNALLWSELELSQTEQDKRARDESE